MPDPNLLPRILYGDLETTRRAWQKIARRAWRVGEWGDSFERDGMVHLPDFPGDILLARGFCGTGIRRREPLWRLYWASKSVSMAYKGVKTDEVEDRAAHLLLGGMEHAWFTVGMLRAEDADLFQPLEPVGRRQTYSRKLLERFVSWLPEILNLCSLFADEASYSYELRGIEPMSSTGALVGWAGRAGYYIPQFSDAEFNWVEFVSARYNGDVVRWFIDLGIIRKQGDRFVLQDSAGGKGDGGGQQGDGKGDRDGKGDSHEWHCRPCNL
jgi:hypothetical protein